MREKLKFENREPLHYVAPSTEEGTEVFSFKFPVSSCEFLSISPQDICKQLRSAGRETPHVFQVVTDGT